MYVKMEKKVVTWPMCRLITVNNYGLVCATTAVTQLSEILSVQLQYGTMKVFWFA